MTAGAMTAAQGQTATTGHVEIGNDGPGQIYVGESRGQAGAPVFGPAAPAEADLLWATGTTAAMMADPTASMPQREAAAEAEQAAYTAARHLGLDDPEPGLYQLPEIGAPEIEAEI